MLWSAEVDSCGHDDHLWLISTSAEVITLNMPLGTLRFAFEDRVSYPATEEMDRTDRIVVTGDREVDLFRVGICIDDSNDLEIDNVINIRRSAFFFKAFKDLYDHLMHDYHVYSNL